MTDNEGNKGDATNTSIVGIANVCVKSVAVVFGSSARWMMSIAGIVES